MILNVWTALQKFYLSIIEFYGIKNAATISMMISREHPEKIVLFIILKVSKNEILSTIFVLISSIYVLILC